MQNQKTLILILHKKGFGRQQRNTVLPGREIPEALAARAAPVGRGRPGAREANPSYPYSRFFHTASEDNRNLAIYVQFVHANTST
jgi:hypothetical protein